MKLSCCDATFPKLSFEASLRLIKALEIDHVDVCVFTGYEHVTPEAVLADPAQTARAVRAQLENAELEVADVFWIPQASFDDLAVNHPEAAVREESREKFRLLLEFAHELGGIGITILPGVPWPGETAERALGRAAEELSWRVGLAAEASLPVSVEPHYQSIAPDVESTLELCRQAPGLTLTLDHSHFVFQGIPEEATDVLIPRTRHVQARQGGVGMMQASAREGELDYERIIRALEDGGYDGFFSLEYCWDAWLDCDRVDCVSETALLRDVFRRVHRPRAAPA